MDFPEFMESPLPKSAQGADHRHSASDIEKTVVAYATTFSACGNPANWKF
jgi:hypothetical protein